MKEGALTYAPAVWLPPKPPPRERYLSRQEAARLLRAARREPKARWHLPLFILICLYCGPRRSSVLALQWQPNTEGGWVDLDRGMIDFNPVARTQTSKRRARTPIPDQLLPFRHARRRTRQFVIEVDGQPLKGIKRSFATAASNAGAVPGHAARPEAHGDNLAGAGRRRPVGGRWLHGDVGGDDFAGSTGIIRLV